MFEKIDITDLLERKKFKGGMDSVYMPTIICAECNSTYSIEKGWGEDKNTYMMTLYHTTSCSDHPEKKEKS